MVQPLKWGILATGSIANTFAKTLARASGGVAVAVASRSQESADRFGEAYKIPRRHGSYQGLLDDPEVQAIYVSTPHPMHVEWVIKAARAGKHILCEKPIGMNRLETRRMIDAADAADVCLMEAYMYRFHPQTRKVIELIRGGEIGEVRHIDAVYGFTLPVHANNRLTDKSLGGGAILDVGCYPVSMSRLIAGIALGKDFADPVDVQASGHLGDSGVDEWSSAVVEFPDDIIARWSTGIRVDYDNGLRVQGTKGAIHVPHAFHPAYFGGDSTISLRRTGSPAHEIIVPADKPLFTIAIEAFCRAVADGKRQLPEMSWDDSLGNMRSLDLWRQCLGLRYDADEAA